MENEELTERIIGYAYKLHNILGPGFLEKVYENALRIELEKAGINVKQQEPVAVYYEGQVMGKTTKSESVSDLTRPRLVPVRN
jgi:GxxExxY protein